MDSADHAQSGSKHVRAGWITTALVALLMAFSGALYVLGPPSVVEGFHHLGYPDYFRVLLGVAKLAGAAALLTRWRALREWAYAGFTFDLLAAIASHAVRGDGRAVAFPFAILLLLAASYHLRQRRIGALGTRGVPRAMAPLSTSPRHS
jgi:hypothetical protein